MMAAPNRNRGGLRRNPQVAGPDQPGAGAAAISPRSASSSIAAGNTGSNRPAPSWSLICPSVSRRIIGRPCHVADDVELGNQADFGAPDASRSSAFFLSRLAPVRRALRCIVSSSTGVLDLPPRIGGLRSEDHAASAMPTPFMMVRASVGV